MGRCEGGRADQTGDEILVSGPTSLTCLKRQR
jgi:hypothetical protein